MPNIVPVSDLRNYNAVIVFFKGQAIQWNHIAAFACIVLAVFFVFLK